MEAVESKPTSIFEKKSTRRAFLRGSRDAALGFAAVLALAACRQLPNEPASTHIQKEVAKSVEISGFEKIKQRIHQTPGMPEDKELATAIVDKFIQLEKAIAQLKSAYEARKEPDGTPTLLAQTMAKFGKLDISPLIGDEYKTEDEFWQNQIFFLRDERRIKKLAESILSLQNQLPNSQLLSEIKNKLREQDPVKNSSLAFYFEIGSFEKNEVKIIPIAPVEGVGFPQKFYTLEKARLVVEQTLQQIPQVGEVAIYLLPTNPYFIGFGGLFFSEGKIVFNHSEKFPELKDAELKPGQSGIVLAVDSLSLPRNIAHELGHVANLAENYKNLSRHIPPEKIVELIILANKIVLDQKWTQLTPTSELLFSDKMRRAFGAKRPQLKNQALTSEDFKLQKALRQDDWLKKDWLIFGAKILDPTLPEKFADQTTVEPYYYGTEPREGYGDIPPIVNFIAMEKERLDQLAASNPIWGRIIKTIRQDPNRFTFFNWVVTTGVEHPWVKDPPSFWRSLPTFGNLILLEEFFENNRQITEMLEGTIKQKAVKEMVDRQNQILKEMQAEHLALTITQQGNLTEADSDPGLFYLQKLQEVLIKTAHPIAAGNR